MAVSVFARVGCNDQHEFGIAKLFGALYIFQSSLGLCSLHVKISDSVFARVGRVVCTVLCFL